MAFLDDLQSHCGGLVRLRTQLFWYGRGWDATPGNLCLLLDADADLAAEKAAAEATGATTAAFGGRAACVHLLIDGQPRWVRVAEEDVELL